MSGKKREKFTREELKNILEETCLSDQCVDAVQAEMQLFFYGIGNCSQVMSVKRVSNKVLIAAGEKIFWLSGDNLGTRKRVYSCLGKPESVEKNVENCRCLCAYALMPYKKGNMKSNINVIRANASEYRDNPFLFYKTLENLYKAEFIKDNLDIVEKVIVENREFWQLFKDENNRPSYEEYIDCFCLNCLTELENNAEFKVYFSKGWKEGNWEVYQRLLVSFLKKRREEMKKRINIVGV